MLFINNITSSNPLIFKFGIYHHFIKNDYYNIILLLNVYVTC
jgi:hypothetical protein